MKEDIIRQVREAENQAEQTIQNAKAEADTLLKNARHQLIEQRQEILETARAKAKQLFETGAASFEPEARQMRQNFQDEIAKDTGYAQKNIDAVVEFVVAQFQKQFNVE